MSLKSFHIFFIAVSILFSFGFGIWAVRFSQTQETGLYLAFGLLSVVVGIALIVYGIKFLRKTRHLGYL